MGNRGEETQAVVRADRVGITAVVAAYNEERYIGQCLMSLLAQRGLDAPLEILVIDGGSRDRTVDIVRSLPEFGTTIRLVENRRRLQVYAWNLALREMRGEYFAMILAHSEYAPDYFASCLEVLRRTGAAAVGGVQRPVGSGIVGRAIAWCMSTPIGMGNARYRYASEEQESSSVFSIFARRDTLLSIGGYDESLPFDEDSDLCYRLRANGGRCVTSPRIQVRYFVRRSFKSLWKQMFGYGFWRRFTQLKHPHSVPLRVLAPSVLVAAAALSLVMAFTPLRAVSVVVPALYAAFILTAAVLAIPSAGPSAVLVPAALATMHAAYGVGYWKALLTGPPRVPGKRGRTSSR